MALRSMTGFGRAVTTQAGTSFVVEIRAVNHRFLDFKIRLANELGALEADVRAVVSGRLSRGRVSVSVSTDTDEAEGEYRVVLDQALAHEVHRAHRTLAETFGVENGLRAVDLARTHGVLRVETCAVEADEVRAGLLAAVGEAADMVVAMRDAEGTALANTIEAHLERIEALRGALSTRAPRQAAAYRTRLESRLRELLETVDVTADEGRILHEVAVFAEKTDVAEELARLKGHVDHVRTLMADVAGEAVGRRLDFMCQELNREVNTVGSKAQDMAMTEVVVELKGELERLREQIQNVE
jgi:uncharacterized protein (TIGR00255 family)